MNSGSQQLDEQHNAPELDTGVAAPEVSRDRNAPQVY